MIKKKIKIVLVVLLFIIVLLIIIRIVSTDSFIACGITFEIPWLEIKDSSGNKILVIDKNGNMNVNSTSVSSNTTPPNSLINSLIIKKGNTNKFSFNRTNAYISGLVQNNTAVTDGDGDDLIIKNGGGIIAKFDGTTGYINIGGSACGVDLCGDDVKDSSEVCDGTDLGGTGCPDLGFSTGTLACFSDCSAFDTSGCIL